MKVFGFYDWHSCSVTLVEDNKIIAAIDEERLSRNKIDFGMPYRSINKILEITNTSWKEIDAIAVPGLRDPIPFARQKTSVFKFEREMNPYWNLQYVLWRIIYNLRQIKPLPEIEKWLNRKIVFNKIRKITDFDKKKIYLVDHHLAHAASGYRTSGFNKALILAIDGSGDGYSTTIFNGQDGEIKFLAGSSEKASLGKLYTNVTLGLGFKKLSDEGKIMGLAAYGNPNKLYPQIDKVIKIKNVNTLEMKATEDLVGNSYAKKIKKLAKKYKREDISAAVQKKLEVSVKEIIEHFVKKTRINRIVLVGGVVANVKMNQMVRELNCVEDTFIFPNMGDGGISSGAALEICYQLTKNKRVHFVPEQIKDVYLGPEYFNQEIKKIIKKNTLKSEFVEDIDTRIGQLVSQGKIVARFNGRMEFGPRTLGNRSILALVTDPKTEDILNERLKRDEFMPFAPSIAEEYAIKEYLIKGRRSPFMTETFSVKPGLKKKFPAIVHVDNTLRPQTVDKKTNPGYRKIIDIVGKATGNYLVLNTSFNMHGEPIVCSPQDAINTFKQGCVDYLALGNYLLKYN